MKFCWRALGWNFGLYSIRVWVPQSVCILHRLYSQYTLGTRVFYYYSGVPSLSVRRSWKVESSCRGPSMSSVLYTRISSARFGPRSPVRLQQQQHLLRVLLLQRYSDRSFTTTSSTKSKSVYLGPSGVIVVDAIRETTLLGSRPTPVLVLFQWSRSIFRDTSCCDFLDR